jgi:hypothetical protein
MEEEEEERKKAYADLLLQAVRRHTMLPSDAMKSVLRYGHALPFPFSPDGHVGDGASSSSACYFSVRGCECRHGNYRAVRGGSTRCNLLHLASLLFSWW